MPRSGSCAAGRACLGRLAGVAFRHRLFTLLAWVVAFGVAFGLSTPWAGDFTADYSAPGADSTRAQRLLEERFPAAAGTQIDVVVRADATVTDPRTRQQVTALLRRFASGPNVAAVGDPYATPGAISQDGHVLLTRITLDRPRAADVPAAGVKALIGQAGAAGPGLEVSLGGEVVGLTEQGAIGSEAIGLAAAAVILLLTFGSVVAAGLPIGTALAGLAVSSMLTGLVAAVMPVPDWSTSLATMIGIGVGIDYALLLVTRFREFRAGGLNSERATVATLDTAGRAVLLAGGTVVVSMLGLFAMGLAYMRGAALVTIIAVLVVMLSAFTLFPALLALLGDHLDRLRIPLPRRRSRRSAAAAGSTAAPGGRWLAWSRLVQRRRVAATVLGTGLLLLIAAPFLDVRFGSPDAGNDPAGSSTRTTYTAVADAFGPGANGPLLVVADLKSAPAGGRDAVAVLARVEAAVRATPGVAATSGVVPSPAGDAAIITVTPTTGPQAAATENLVTTLRDRVLPGATAGSGLVVHVGGVTAAAIDSTANVTRRLPLLLVGVVALSMLLLFVAFRSVAVPLKAAAMNLLSVAAAYGVVAFVLQGGWAGRLFGIEGATPLPAFIPVLMFAVLFGLSMDYEVFLLARMRETWLRTGDSADAVVSGLAGTARVITAAAAIMVAVFAAFIPSPELPLKVIGIGMASAILIDATLVRLLLVPAVMYLLGDRAWWLPRWADQRLPQVHIEGHQDRYLPVPAQRTAR